MSSIGKVAIIGRPNVGKSTLFNILTGTRRAVVKNEPGVTRDVQYGTVEWCGLEFEVADTGGLTESADVFSKLIREQVGPLLERVDAMILVMDGKSGLCPEDRDVFLAARRAKKPFLIVVNKVDRRDLVHEKLSEFYEFGEDLVAAAFEQRDGVTEIVEWVVEKVGATPREPQPEAITLAIVGKPNAGKSSLCNHLLGEDRMMVSEIAGTTVDAVDSELIYDDQRYLIIDTAGLRRRARQNDGIEKIAGFKSRDAIGRADLVLLVIDAVVGPAEQDARIIEMILENHKGVILVANKADIGEAEIPEFRKTFRAQVEKVFHFFPDIPIVFTSAKTGRGIKDLFLTIQDIWKKLNIEISTGALNRFFMEAIRSAPAPVAYTRDVKFYYLTQTKQVPPSFIAFANFPEGVTTGYRRFLAKKIKEEWDLDGVPVRIFAMKSRGTGERDLGGPAR